MEIQRVKFLLIASALAAPACVTTVTDENAGSGTGGSTGSSTGGAQNGTGGRNGGTGGRGTGGNVSHDGGGPSTGGSDASTTDGSAGRDGSAGGADGSAGSDGNSGDGAISDGRVTIDANRPDGNGCDDDNITGGYGDCNLLARDGCADGAFQMGQCNDTKATMKPFIAQQTIKCILEDAGCDVIETYKCKDKAVHIACLDPTADDECATIHTACSSVDESECKQYLSGLTQAGRDSMVSCLTGNCSFGLYTCVEGL